jgi:hypothetical protein
MLRVAWVGNPSIMNWQDGMTSATFLLVPVSSCTNHGLTCINGAIYTDQQSEGPHNSNYNQGRLK